MTTKRVDVPAAGFSEDDSAPASNLSSMQRAIVTIQKLRGKLEALERARTESIAIIGMACRFPGGGDTPESFFQLLVDGVDAVTEVPPERWLLDSDQPTDPEARAVRWGAFLQSVDQFDAQFFGISPREASKMDPQQRLLLEVTFEALERAGQIQERLLGSRTGVFLGIMNNDYAELSASAGPAQEDTYTTTGNGHCFPAGRVSYTFGFQGPSVAVDTACSSSLVAVHLASQSLRNGECNLAIAGGVNLMLVPSTSRKYAKTQALSPDGRCKSFDATANGFVRGEGCGIIVLKRLSDAERDGDPIIAVIRGSAINQDGRSTGLTAPNVLAQQAMLMQALASARVAAADIGYVETHGTGTPLGDPIEVEALHEVLGAPRPSGSPCVLGAVKTNVGHLEAAAGVAGIIKTALILHRGVIPRNIHFRTLNPRIRIESTPFVFPEETLPWTTGMKRRIAGVSSFGMSGTNAHAILEDWPLSVEEDLSPEGSALLLPLSAKSPDALRSLASAYRDYLTHMPTDVRLRDVVHTASVRRSHYDHRLTAVGNSREEIVKLLDGYLRGEIPSGVAQGKSTPARAKVVFIFSGQGSQWLGMGRQLYETDSSFRSVIDTCDNLMTPRLGWSILDELDAPEGMSRISETQVAQPLLFAVQVALVEMLRSWGIPPDAMIGHSVGEVAAAHIAGIFSLDEAIRLVALRGRIMQKATGMGKMISVDLTPDEANSILSGYEDRVSIAAINDPNSVVLSGQSSALDDVALRCEKRGVSVRPLRVNYAFHSPQMDALGRELVDRLVRVDARRATLAMYSTLLGECVDGKELDVHYWGRSLREAVNFAGAVGAAIRDGYKLFLEVGPHPVLTANVLQCLAAKGADGTAVFAMRRNQDQLRMLLDAVGTLYTRGCSPEWSRLIPSGGRCVPLPTYPWQRQRHWIASSTNTLPPTSGVAHFAAEDVHPFLGICIESANRPGSYTWQRTMNTDEPAFIHDHVVDGEAIFPAAGYVAMALAAGATHYPETNFIRHIGFERMLSFHADERKTIQLDWTPDGRKNISFSVSSRASGGRWAKNVSGTLTTIDTPSSLLDDLVNAIDTVAARCSVRSSGADHYQRMATLGLRYGPAFRVVQELSLGTEEVLAKLRCTESGSDDLHMTTVVLLDGAFQSLAALGIHLLGDAAKTFVPTSIDHVRVLRSIDRDASVLGRIRSCDASAISGDVCILANDGSVAIVVEGLVLRPMPARSVDRHHWLDDCTFRLEWRRRSRALTSVTKQGSGGGWLVLGGEGAVCASFVDLLRQRGEWVVHVHFGREWEQRKDWYQIDAANPAHYLAVLEDAYGNHAACRNVVHMGALDSAHWNETTPESLLADQQIGSISVLHTVQAIIRRATRTMPRLWLVTQGAQTVDPRDGPGSIAQAAIWGMARTVALEHPDFDCSRVDLDPTDDSSAASRALLDEVLSADQEDQIALRKHGRHVARFARSSLRPALEEPLAIAADAAYLITGGLGGLGLSFAEWMVQQGARHLALVGRRGADEHAAGRIRSMEEMGARILVLQGDVSQRADVDAILRQMEETFPPLRGIVHAAAVLADHTILELTADEMRSVLAPKLIGAYHLHKLTVGNALDFFVVYSSVSGVIGSSGQANYAAANAAVDALCRARRAAGLPAMSFQWGPFNEIGMAVVQENRGARLAQRGLESLSPAEGHETVSRLGASSIAEVAVLRFDARRWLDVHLSAAKSPFWMELRKERSSTSSMSKQSASMRHSLAGKPAKEQVAIIESHIRHILANVLHLDPSRVDLTASLTSLGMDSLTSLELRNRLETSLELKLPATLLFTYPNGATLVKHLFDRCTQTAEQPTAAPAPVADSNVEVPETSTLSTDDELLAAFDASMTDIKDQGLV